MDLKKKPKRYIEYCVFEGVKADSLEYNQIAFLVAEDFPETQFYIRDKEGEKEGSALKFWCVDKYYPEDEYRFESNYSKMNYSNIARFLIVQFKYRNLQLLNYDLV